MPATAKTYEFTLILKDATEITQALEDALFEAGCDDTLLWSRDGVVGLHFGREAASLGEAVGSAIANIERAGYQVARVEVTSARSLRP